MATKKKSTKKSGTVTGVAALEKYNYILANIKCPTKDKAAWWAKFKATCKKNECKMSDQLGMLVDDWMKS